MEVIPAVLIMRKVNQEAPEAKTTFKIGSTSIGRIQPLEAVRLMSQLFAV